MHSIGLGWSFVSVVEMCVLCGNIIFNFIHWIHFMEYEQRCVFDNKNIDFIAN